MQYVLHVQRSILICFRQRIAESNFRRKGRLEGTDYNIEDGPEGSIMILQMKTG